MLNEYPHESKQCIFVLIRVLKLSLKKKKKKEQFYAGSQAHVFLKIPLLVINCHFEIYSPNKMGKNEIYSLIVSLNFKKIYEESSWYEELWYICFEDHKWAIGALLEIACVLGFWKILHMCFEVKIHLSYSKGTQCIQWANQDRWRQQNNKSLWLCSLIQFIVFDKVLNSHHQNANVIKCKNIKMQMTFRTGLTRV